MNNQGNKNTHFPLVQILYNTTVYKDNTKYDSSCEFNSSNVIYVSNVTSYRT